MRHKIPAIKSVMTPFPYWVAANATLAQAIQIMNQRTVHHLPVKDEGNLVGVLTRSDIEQFLNHNDTISSEQLFVSNACVKQVYVVDLDEPLDNVLFHLTNFHIGSALVTKNGRLAGLFTQHDACRCFGEFLREQFGSPTNGNDAA